MTSTSTGAWTSVEVQCILHSVKATVVLEILAGYIINLS